MKLVIKMLMKQQDVLVDKNVQAQLESKSELDKLGISKESEFYEFYSQYYARALNHNYDATSDMIDCISPNKGLVRIQNFAQGYWSIPDNYILFTTGDVEGGYLYNKDNGTVWDFTFEKKELLGIDEMPHWNSFYEFLEWYLTVDE